MIRSMKPTRLVRVIRQTSTGKSSFGQRSENKLSSQSLISVSSRSQSAAHLSKTLSVTSENKKKYREDRFPVRHRSTGYLSKDCDSVPESFKDQVKPFSSIPGPRGVPFFGTFFLYKLGIFNVDKLHDVILGFHKKYGKIMKETINGNTIVHLFDPDFLLEYFRQEDNTPETPPLVAISKAYREKRGQSLGLGNTQEEEWYRLRSGVNHVMLRPKSVSVFFPEVNEVSDDFINKISETLDTNGQVADFQTEALKWGLDSAWMTAFGTKIGAIQTSNPEVDAFLKAQFEIITTATKVKFALPWFKFFNTPKRRQVFDAEDTILRIVDKYLRKTLSEIQKLEDSGEIKDNQFVFLRYLLSRPQLNYSDVLILTLSLPFDGISTTPRMLLYNLYRLAKNPDVQEKLFQEVNHHYDGNELTHENVFKMSYLKACVKETFRFHPIGLEISRINKNDLVIDGYNIPAGSTLEMNNYVMTQSPEYFNDPHVYNPDRWTKDATQQKIHPYIMIPFGHGARMCIGRRIAEQELYTMIAKIVKNFRIEWPYDDIQMNNMIFMQPDRPMQFKFTRR